MERHQQYHEAVSVQGRVGPTPEDEAKARALFAGLPPLDPDDMLLRRNLSKDWGPETEFVSDRERAVYHDDPCNLAALRMVRKGHSDRTGEMGQAGVWESTWDMLECAPLLFSPWLEEMARREMEDKLLLYGFSEKEAKAFLGKGFRLEIRRPDDPETAQRQLC